MNDGGNIVDDGFGNVVLSRKFLKDNRLTEHQARQKIKKLNGIDQVSFIEADEQGGLEHADGVVSFIDEKVIVVNEYLEDVDYAQKLEHDLRRGIKDLKIEKIIFPYDDSEIYDDRFGSACGIYTNMLVTPERIYFPQFGLPEDAIALKQIQSLTDKDIIPVDSHQVCHMGGGVRCMSWQLRGENMKKLLNFVERVQR